MPSITSYSCLLLAISILLYLNSLDCDFVFDDVVAVEKNLDIRPETPLLNLFYNDFWGTPMHDEKSHKSYRPLTVLSFRLNYLIGGTNPVGHHAVNVLLHAVVVLLFFRFCRDFIEHTVFAFVGALVFAVHPIHVEAVTGVVGRAELLSAIIFLISLRIYKSVAAAPISSSKNWMKLCGLMGLVGAGTICKEQCITVVGVCVLFEAFCVHQITFLKLKNFFTHQMFSVFTTNSNPSNPQNPPSSSKSVAQCQTRHFINLRLARASLIRCIVLAAGCGSFLLARVRVMGAQLPSFTSFDNPAAASAFPARHLTFNFLLPFNAWLILAPSPLCCDWTMGSIRLLQSVWDARNLATLAFYAVLSGIAVLLLCGTLLNQADNDDNADCDDSEHCAVAMAISISACSFLPASNLFFPVGFVVAERVLYTPSMGFCLLFALGLQRLASPRPIAAAGSPLRAAPAKSQLLLVGTVCLMIGAFCLKTVTRNSDWKSELSLFRAALKVNTRNAKLWNNVGHALESDGGPLRPANHSAALAHFQRAVHVQPDDIGAHVNCGNALRRLARMSEAEAAYRTAIRLMPQPIRGRNYSTRVAPKDLTAFTHLASLLAKRAELAQQSGGAAQQPIELLNEADALLRRVLSMRPDLGEAMQTRADILIRLANQQLPSNPASHKSQLQRRAALVRTALDMIEGAVRLDGGRSADLAYNRGAILMEAGQHARALHSFREALRLKPSHVEARKSLASMYSAIGEIDDAIFGERYDATQQSEIERDKRAGDTSSSRRNSIITTVERRKRARNIYQQLAKEGHQLEQTYFNLAMLATDEKFLVDAEQYYKAAIKENPSFRSALFNLALLYNNELKQFEKAREIALQLLKHHPRHFKGHLLLGDIELNVMHNLDAAEKYFNAAHELQPGDQRALHNVCVVMVERNNLRGGLDCLRRALQIDGSATHIQHHIELVEQKLRSSSPLSPSSTSKEHEKSDKKNPKIGDDDNDDND